MTKEKKKDARNETTRPAISISLQAMFGSQNVSIQRLHTMYFVPDIKRPLSVKQSQTNGMKSKLDSSWSYYKVIIAVCPILKLPPFQEGCGVVVSPLPLVSLSAHTLKR